MSWLSFALVFLLAVGLAYGLTPLSIRLGRRWGLVDVAGGRRTHQGAVVRIGGLLLFPAFAVAALVTWGIPRNDPLELTRLVGVLLSLGVAWLLGLLDDRYRLSSWAQLAGLVAAALLAIAFKVFIELFNNPFAQAQVKVEWFLMVPITLVWLVGMAGTVNMMDGLDGLATGVTGIAALVLFVHMLRLEQYSVALLPLALLGCCLGFLPYNFNPARIFLGGGAYVLGFALGTLSILSGAKVATVLLVIWLPIVDAAWQVYARWRRGQPVALGDRGHLHFRLQDLGWPTRRIVLLYYGVTILLGAVALLVSSRMLKFAVLLGVGLAIVVALAMLARASGDRTATGK
jgi:UDP-N-acetylmuramyl pentapeptide phosphotransferase/UDP-N-acetylglucosamine-1-phosphate transferase